MLLLLLYISWSFRARDAVAAAAAATQEGGKYVCVYTLLIRIKRDNAIRFRDRLGIRHSALIHSQTHDAFDALPYLSVT